MRQRLLLDVDGILADFVGPFLDVINRLTGGNHRREDVTEWDICKALNLSKEVEHAAYEEAHKKGFCFNLPVFEGAKEGVEALSQDYDIFYVTSPMLGDYWMSERTRWLQVHFGAKPRQVAHVSSKFIVEGDFLVDDKYENLVPWRDAAHHHFPILWDTPHNRKDPADVHRVHDWGTLAQTLWWKRK